ncbi:hypothetical protein F2P56_009698 [Juglans regia]|uniref:Retrotransposon Copia-like N-terminal domain-containing protein n=1 Tax=Juglans regia TaxID=51240 RepID=A0A833XX75_JUGRE|nr:hypothetical protein F2P56_009698 [Juglans regia]
MVESGFSSSFHFAFPNPTQLISIKLDETNYLAWTAQFKPILKSHNLLGFIDGSNLCPAVFVDDNAAKNESVNPAYTSWQSRDQLLLSWIISSISPALVASLYGLDSSFLAWQSLVACFASQSKFRISHLKRQLQNLQQGFLTCASYLAEAKFLADQLSAVGKPVDDDDLISFIIGGLNPTFTQFITSYSFHTREASMSFFYFRSELLNHEIILNRHAPLNLVPKTSSFALFTNRPKFQPVKRKLQFSGFSNTDATKLDFSLKPAPSISTKDVRPVSNSGGRSPCQICKGNNHQALDCFRPMDFSYQGCHPPTDLASMVADINAEFLNCQWLADSRANAHVTNNVENLDSKRPFDGNETISIGNGAGQSDGNHAPSGSE